MAVGGDERVLITTRGNRNGRQSAEYLLIYDPTSGNVSALSVAPPAPRLRADLQAGSISSRSHLMASRDGRYIIGLNNPSTTDAAGVRLRDGFGQRAAQPQRHQHFERALRLRRRLAFHGRA